MIMSRAKVELHPSLAHTGLYYLGLAFCSVNKWAWANIQTWLCLARHITIGFMHFPNGLLEIAQMA